MFQEHLPVLRVAVLGTMRVCVCVSVCLSVCLCVCVCLRV